MKRLNSRERKVVAVSCDLLLKGSPEWRIAEYAAKQGLTGEQLNNLLEKLRNVLTKETRFLIGVNFRSMNMKECSDMSKIQGQSLREWLVKTDRGEA